MCDFSFPCPLSSLPTHTDLMGLIDGYIPDLINFSNSVSGFVGGVGCVTLGLPRPGAWGIFSGFSLNMELFCYVYFLFCYV